MSEYDLIPEDAYSDLPQEPLEQFAVLVRIAQSNLARLLDQSAASEFEAELRSQFISIIRGIAEALDIDGLPESKPEISDYRQYQVFQIYLAGIVARVRLQSQTISRPTSVQLGRITKARIQQEVDQLRRLIENSELGQSKKSALTDKLEELLTELDKKRLSFARTMAIVASIMTAVAGGTAALANGPKAVDTLTRIIRYIGEDKEREEEERLRLAPPPKALPDLRHGFGKGFTFPDDAEDDDVPF